MWVAFVSVGKPSKEDTACFSSGRCLQCAFFRVRLRDVGVAMGWAKPPVGGVPDKDKSARLLTLVAPLMDDCCGRVPKGLITVETARFSLLGDLLKLKARLTFLPVRVANLRALLRALVRLTSLVSISRWWGSMDTRKFSTSFLQAMFATVRHKVLRKVDFVMSSWMSVKVKSRSFNSWLLRMMRAKTLWQSSVSLMSTILLICARFIISKCL